jgi:hypothetical protein
MSVPCETSKAFMKLPWILGINRRLGLNSPPIEGDFSYLKANKHMFLVH